MQKKFPAILITFLLVLAAACGSKSGSADSMSQTLTPMNAALAATLTARVVNAGGAGDQLATAVANATRSSGEIYATQTILASLDNESNEATATAIAPVVAELPRYGVDPANGRVAWLHRPVVIQLNGYQQFDYANDYPQVIAADFVIAADIQWFTFNSLSACGFMFRSDGNKTKPNQYMLFITRYATGYLAFTATVNGEVSNVQTFFPKQQDKSFNWANNGTNRLAVVVRGNMIYAYTNGILVATIDITQPPPASMPMPPLLPPVSDLPPGLDDYESQVDQFSQSTSQLQSQLVAAQRNFDKNKPLFSNGLLGFLGVSQSGQTVCTFSNAWLFIIEK